MSTILARQVLLAIAVAASGCRSKENLASPAPDPDTPVIVEVENHYHGDVVIYLLTGSQRQRLGMVTALSTGEYSFPWRYLSRSGMSRLLAYPIAGARAHATDPLLLQPGQGIKWTLEADLDRSSMAVY
jgi:hypothetical protein